MTASTIAKPSLPLPRGAHAIADLRRLGKRPGDAVVVSFLGDVWRPRNPTVFVDSGRRYDWAWLRGLAVIVAVDRRLDCMPVVRDVAEATHPWPQGYVTMVEPDAGIVAAVLAWTPAVKLWPAAPDIAKEYLSCV